MATVSLNEWLNELETTTLPQSRGCGTAECPCALTMAIVMSGEEFNAMPTVQAMGLLGAHRLNLAHEHVSELNEALRQVYVWNDISQLSFPAIAERFRARNGPLIKICS